MDGLDDWPPNFVTVGDGGPERDGIVFDTPSIVKVLATVARR
jgi:hypothetical protein